MAITRTQDIDDDGTGTTGTIRNNAWKQQLYDQIDAADGLTTPATIPYSTSNFGSSAGTWSVEAGDVLLNKWARLDPKHVHWCFYLSATSLLTSTAANLLIQNLPFSVVGNQVVRVGWAAANGAFVDAYLQAQATGTTVALFPTAVLGGATWPIATNTITVALSCVLETP